MNAVPHKSNILIYKLFAAKEKIMIWMHKISFFYEIFPPSIIYIQAIFYVIKHVVHNED